MTVDLFVGKVLDYISMTWFNAVQPYINDIATALQEIPAERLAVLDNTADALQKLISFPIMSSRSWVKDSPCALQFLVFAKDTIEAIKMLKAFNVMPVVLSIEEAQFLYNYVYGPLLFKNVNPATLDKLIKFQKAAIADNRGAQLLDVLAKDVGAKLLCIKTRVQNSVLPDARDVGTFLLADNSDVAKQTLSDNYGKAMALKDVCADTSFVLPHLRRLGDGQAEQQCLWPLPGTYNHSPNSPPPPKKNIPPKNN